MGLGSSYLGLKAQSDTLAHVYLVGAGISGAGTGHHINRATRITVLEASDRAGGRIIPVEKGNSSKLLTMGQWDVVNGGISDLYLHHVNVMLILLSLCPRSVLSKSTCS
jgi:monoamine oxidase